MFQDTIKITGDLTITLTDQQGNVKDRRDVKNLVVTAGKILIASRLVNGSDPVPGWMELGTSNTAAAVGQTALVSPISGSRTALSGTSRVNNVITYTTTFVEGVGTGAITEAGIFNAASGGTMLCRTVFGTVTKEVSDVLTVNWNLTIN